MSEKTEACPDCGREMPVNPGFVTWCDHCHWNIDPYIPKSRRDRLWARLNKWLGSNRNAAIFEQIRGEWQSGFRLTPSRLLAYSFAALWYGLVCWVAYKTFMIFYEIRTLGDLLAGLFFAGLTFVLVPRVYRLKKPKLDRREYPALYRAADEAAAFLGAPPVDGIVINLSFNAAYTISGFRRKKLLIIGLPLFASLTPEEKLAIISHELGHHANRDITRSSFLGGVQRALGRLYITIYPKTDFSDILSSLARLLEWFRKGLAYVVLVPWYAIGLAVWADSQRAEYGADYAAASVAGTRAAASALRKMCYGPTFYKALDMVAEYRYTANLFEEFRGRIRSVPSREVERIRILTELTESRIESTHPPTRYRLAFMEEKLPSAAPVLPPELLIRMEEEFLALEAIWEKRMLTDYRSYMYDTY
ncbi:M48 family metallopeptidase [Paenibacillus hamazuiensis]|uniref:M48 family metallopeptidase n=1 Tax=Paenibacillus hamazuiensis TaxID=2936508 RepID=UPI00200D947C|nr:M48 family metallopeptidase [Paenibacillus hamazuiensis]